MPHDTLRNRNRSYREKHPFEPDPARRPPVVIKMRNPRFDPGSIAWTNARLVRALAVSKKLTPKPPKPRMAGGSRKYTEATRRYWALRNSGYGDRKCRVRGWTPTTLAFRYAGSISERVNAEREASKKKSRKQTRGLMSRVFGAITGRGRRG